MPRVVVDDYLPIRRWVEGDERHIYFTTDHRGLSRVARPVVTVSSIDSTGPAKDDFPDVLPGSQYAVVMLWRGSAGANHIGLVNLKNGEVTDLAEGTYARYAPPPGSW